MIVLPNFRQSRALLTRLVCVGFLIQLTADLSAQTSPYTQQRRETQEAAADRYAEAANQTQRVAQAPATRPRTAADAVDIRPGAGAYLADRSSSTSRNQRSQPTGQLGQPIAPGSQLPGSQPQATQPPAASQGLPGRPRTPAPPFQLNDVEHQFVRQILEMWENRSNDVKTFNSDFERLDYNLAFGQADRPMTRSTGQLSYSKPDKGSFKIKEIKRWAPKDPQNSAKDAPGDWVVQKNEIGEHWVCDGKAIYEYFQPKKQLRVQPIPPEMRGESIVNGPLPFLFGAKADDLEKRYWIRAKESDPETIWLEAHPRWQADAANYRMVDIMLDRKSMLPKALQVHEPNGQSRSVYMFNDPTVNGTLDSLFGNLFSAPRTPLGWKRVVEHAPVAPQASNQQPLQR
ncbi:TIGR03009 domain-containing protein [Adhaeretor mobilis]|uniref:TIGR03009 domain-containing protein n=1 Tax=Adhaeretor mobilis TaxID=1930276 RepID=A0A517MRW3_9BACT|nr:TIGR03009 domain-containing protein [Adhaeretor mobilis]QDS97621.1 hypothetical protein HG15A2_08850 [Adhaeretor mobilis]